MNAAILLVLLAAQEATPRAEKPWERRVHVPVPVPVELPAVPPTNPFYVPVDVPPAARQTPMREDFATTVPVTFAVYIQTNGTCRRAQPVSNPFPGVLEPVRQAIVETEFSPAKAFGKPVAVWVDVTADLKGEIKEGQVRGLAVTLPDPATTPAEEPSPLPPPDPGDAQLPTSDLAQLSALPAPKRFSAKVPSQEFRQPFKLLAEIGKDGKVKRVVFLACPEGLRPWVLASAGSWVFAPAQVQGAPVAAWVVLSGVLEVRAGTLRAEGLRVSRGSSYPRK
ncbi:MAG: hypothetical protein ACP5NF_02195 [Thermoanaerobaculum sp.]